MFSINLDSLNVNEAELTAFIHQKVDEIQKFADGAPVAMKISSNREGEFCVRIVANHEVGEIRAEGIDKSIFNAISNAKDIAIQCFQEIANISPVDDRDNDIQKILEGKKYTH